MRIVVAGAGLAGRRLITMLTANRHDVIAIDLNRDICELVSSKFGVVAICGNATDITVLEEVEIGKAEVAVALLRQSADNLAFSLLAKGAGVSRIIARMRNPRYREAYEQAGVTSIIDVTGLFLDQLFLEIEQPQVYQLATFASGQGVILTVKIPQTSRATGKAVREVVADRRFPKECLIAGIVRSRGGNLLIPSETERILPDDQLLVCGTVERIAAAIEYFGVRHGLASLMPLKKAKLEPTEPERDVHLELEEALEDKGETEDDPVNM